MKKHFNTIIFTIFLLIFTGCSQFINPLILDIKLQTEGFTGPSFTVEQNSPKDKKLNFKIDEIPGAVEYRILYSTTDDYYTAKDVALIETEHKTVLKYSKNISALQFNTTYYFWVLAYTVSGYESSYRNAVALTLTDKIQVSGLTAVQGDNNKKVTLSWKNIDTVDEYYVFYNYVDDYSTAYKIDQSTNTNEITIKNLKVGIDYYFWVVPYVDSSFMEAGNSIKYTPVPIIDIGKVLLLDLKTSSSSITVSWIVDKKCKYVDIYRARENDFKKAELINEKSYSSSYVDYYSSEKKSAYYWVVPSDSDGNSAAIEDASFSYYVAPALEPPKISSVTAYGDSFTVIWKKVDDAIGYNVYRYTSNNEKFAEKVNEELVSDTSFSDYSISATQKVYYYWVTSVSEDGIEGKKSIPKSNKPDCPSSFSMSSSSSDVKYRLEWGTVTGAKSYNVYRAISNNFAAATKLESQITNNYYITTDVSKTVIYYYWVTTVDADNFESDPSHVLMNFGNSWQKPSSCSYIGVNEKISYWEPKNTSPSYKNFSCDAGKKYQIKWVDSSDGRDVLIGKGYKASDVTVSAYFAGDESNICKIGFLNADKGYTEPKVITAPCNGYIVIKSVSNSSSGYYWGIEVTNVE